jgi:hypothetical protein
MICVLLSTLSPVSQPSDVKFCALFGSCYRKVMILIRWMVVTVARGARAVTLLFAC